MIEYFRATKHLLYNYFLTKAVMWLFRFANKETQKFFIRSKRQKDSWKWFKFTRKLTFKKCFTKEARRRLYTFYPQ